jgi:hypothetical protein
MQRSAASDDATPTLRRHDERSPARTEATPTDLETAMPHIVTDNEERSCKATLQTTPDLDARTDPAPGRFRGNVRMRCRSELMSFLKPNANVQRRVALHASAGTFC